MTNQIDLHGDAPMETSPKIYICHEPDDGGLAVRLDAWPRTNSDLTLYDARQRIPIGAKDVDEIKNRLAELMAQARVFVCLISQATCFDDWVNWEIAAARGLMRPPGMVGILLHEADVPPPGMVDAGAIFVPFSRDKVERAIEWAAQIRGSSKGDFKFIDE